MARGKIARMVIAAAKKQAGMTPGAVKRIRPAAANRIAAFKPFSHPVRTMMKGAMGSMPRARAAPRAPRPFGAPPRRRRVK